MNLCEKREIMQVEGMKTTTKLCCVTMQALVSHWVQA